MIAKDRKLTNINIVGSRLKGILVTFIENRRKLSPYTCELSNINLR